MTTKLVGSWEPQLRIVRFLAMFIFIIMRLRILRMDPLLISLQQAGYIFRIIGSPKYPTEETLLIWVFIICKYSIIETLHFVLLPKAHIICVISHVGTKWVRPYRSWYYMYLKYHIFVPLSNWLLFVSKYQINEILPIILLPKVSITWAFTKVSAIYVQNPINWDFTDHIAT